MCIDARVFSSRRMKDNLKTSSISIIFSRLKLELLLDIIIKFAILKVVKKGRVEFRRAQRRIWAEYFLDSIILVLYIEK
jgi:hypothetical protein